MPEILQILTGPGVFALSGSYLTMWVIILATFISEDLTLIWVGMLIGRREIDPLHGVASCFSGVFLGDVLLYAVGTLIHLSGSATGLARLVPAKVRARTRSLYGNHGRKIIFFSRFVPGLRFVTFLGAGLTGTTASSFIRVAFVAAAIWSPLVLLASAVAGPEILKILTAGLQNYLLAFFLTCASLFVLLRWITAKVSLLSNPVERYRLRAFLSRWSHHEFWPASIFYIPAVFYILFLSLKHRGITLFATANPGIPFGGMVGESKFEILQKLDPPVTARSLLIQKSCEPAAVRIAPIRMLRSWMGKYRIRYPLIMKPDAAQRGAGVRKIHTENEAAAYLAAAHYDVLVQPFLSEPEEAGVLFFRFPGSGNGGIHSVVCKVFPVVAGDGRSTLRELILQHPRFRVQANVFLKRFQNRLDEIPESQKKIQLAVAGNHVQGTMFKDGSHLITAKLIRRLDRVVAKFPGFYIGRFDLKYRNDKQLMEGRGFTILELNGSLGEPTSMYDPTKSLFWALQVQTSHLRLLYQIGALNRDRGIRPPSLIEVIRQVVIYYRKRRIDLISD